MSTATPLLQVRNVSVDYVTDYGNARAVNNVSLDNIIRACANGSPVSVTRYFNSIVFTNN